jgi:serine/threonine protein phosphatase 1
MPRTLVIGDVHGCYDELLALLDAAHFDPTDTLVSVGDLVDRGGQSVEVVRFFRALKGAVVLMGNHERKHVRAVFSYAQEITRLQFGEEYEEARRWMATLPYFYETNEVRVVHAAMIPGVPLPLQKEEILAGTTSGERMLEGIFPTGYWHERYEDAVPVVFGHHVVGPDPFVRDARVFGIDTGACHGDRLTALSLPDLRLYSVAAKEDHWAKTRRTFQVPVLRARVWRTMTWAKLEETHAELARAPELETQAFARALERWIGEVRGALVTIEEAIAAEARRIVEREGEAGFANAARAHPAGPLLFQHHAGRLRPGTLLDRCPTPEHVLDLAARLAVPLDAAPT